MAHSLITRLCRTIRHWPHLLAAILLLNLPAWSGCLAPEPATISDDTISNPTGAGAYSVNIPAGFTAVPLPEYLPHVPFTYDWLHTEEAAPFAGIVQTQALEQKLHADLLLYRRPNYRAYFSISGEDILLVPATQADSTAPSPFLVFTADNCLTPNGQYAFPQLGQGGLRSFGNWLAGSLAEQASDVSEDTRTVLGRKWLWLSARLPYPFPDADATASDTGSTANTESAPVYWYFLYTATLGTNGSLYTIQGWAQPEDAPQMVETVTDLMSSLNTNR